jgi:hypothetical protein
MNAITNYVAANLAFNPTLAAAGFGALVAIEMATRVAVNTFKLYNPQTREEDQTTNNEERKKQLHDDIRTDGAHCLLNCLMATNIIPYTAILGVGIFTIYSLCFSDKEKALSDDYLLSKCIAYPIKFAWDKVGYPVVNCIVQIAMNILSTVSEFLPQDPKWVGILILAAAVSGTAIVRFGLPGVSLPNSLF